MLPNSRSENTCQRANIYKYRVSKRYYFNQFGSPLRRRLRVSLKNGPRINYIFKNYVTL